MRGRRDKRQEGYFGGVRAGNRRMDGRITLSRCLRFPCLLLAPPLIASPKPMGVQAGL